jgi:nitroreductase
MDFIDSVIMTRASVRSFTGEAIPREALIRIAKAGMAAPSAMNVRPWAIVVVEDRAKLGALCDSLPYAKMLDKAAAAFVICGDPRKDERAAVMHWTVDCAAMSENVLLAAHALGYGAVWTAVHPDGQRLDCVRRILGIPAGIVPLDVIPIGVIAGAPPAPKDKYDPAALHFDAW